MTTNEAAGHVAVTVALILVTLIAMTLVLS